MNNWTDLRYRAKVSWLEEDLEYHKGKIRLWKGLCFFTTCLAFVFMVAW